MIEIIKSAINTKKSICAVLAEVAEKPLNPKKADTTEIRKNISDK